MKTIHIAVQGEPSSQWREWVEALSQVGLNANVMAPEKIEDQVAKAHPGDTILLDGLLPDLSEAIYRTCSCAPETNVIVLTEVDSFSIYYEVLSVGGAIYLSGPLSKEHFAEAVKNVIIRELVA